MIRPCFRLAARPIARTLVALGAICGLAILSRGLLAAEAMSEPLPKSFNTQWCAYHSTHFELFTDLPHKQALRTINGLNRFRRMFLGLFPETPGSASPPPTMLVFRREQDFAELTGTSRYAGVTLPSMRGYRLLSAQGQRRAPVDNAWHEYAHYLLRNRTDRNYPLWYEEGLANYLGAADLHRHPVRLGKLPYRRMLAMAKDYPLTFKATVEATSVLGLTGSELTTFYRNAWLLTHFIRLGHQFGFTDMRPALTRYLNSAERDFESAFGQSPAAMGALLAKYLRQRPLPTETLSVPETETLAPTRVCLTPPERDYELAVSIIPMNRHLAIRVLENMAPTVKQLTALSRAVWGDRDRAATLVNKALALAPTDPNANIQQAHLLVRDCAFSSQAACITKWAQAVQLYGDALQRNPTRFDAAYGLGVAYLHTGRAPQAMEYLRLAYEKRPWDVHINFYLGEGYRIAGDRRAVAHLQNARNWAKDEVWQRRAEFSLQRLKDED